MAIEGVVLERLIGWVAPATELDWDVVYAEQLPRVYNFFRYRVGEGPEAEDLTSLTFEKAWRARHRYRRDLASFGTWLMTIARRVAIDRARKLKPQAPLEEAMDVAQGPTPEDLAEARSNAVRLARLVAALPDRERELVALKYGAGWTHRAIARLTGLTETNVGTILHRTVQELRAGWEKEGGR